MKLIQFPALLLFIAVCACAPTNVHKLVEQKGGEQLEPKQVLSLVEGNTLNLRGYDTDAYLYLDRSGKAFAVDIHDNKDLGQWDVSDVGEFCIRMQSWWFGDLKCYQMYQVNDTYKLTDNKGLINFTARQYPGDYKNSYYVLKDKKKSFRNSIRSDKAVAQTAETTDTGVATTAEAESPPVDTPELPEKSITEENTYDVSQRDRNLRSTVKWMAKDCPGCNLSDTNLMKADLVGAKLAGSNLSGSNLHMANMRRADLQGANLQYAILTYCNLPGANLQGANLRWANLKGANLIRADLTGADLTGAELEGALMEGTLLEGAILEDVIGLEKIEQPEKPSDLSKPPKI